MNRCCRDTLKWANIRQPVEGLEIPCRWNVEFLRYEKLGKTDILGWVVHDRVGDFVTRESDPENTATREARYTEILGHERQK